VEAGGQERAIASTHLFVFRVPEIETQQERQGGKNQICAVRTTWQGQHGKDNITRRILLVSYLGRAV
jgi:hypothetical protein